LFWDDDQINKMLGSPVGFRSAFGECGAQDDKEIGSLVGKDPGDDFEFFGPCVKADPNRLTFDMGSSRPIPGVPQPPESEVIPANWKK
jgi:hypothetical protein